MVVALHRAARAGVAGVGSPDTRAAVAFAVCAVACLTVTLAIRPVY